ncbi:MAG TPA: diguanylate cyclase [Devosia sp.]|jgi:diguanylate cyclase (GGDEF)-like protein|uniref:sensor domain-containing diguanylate cyclase n=1 Tax=Devosia sp. TaxID=1871048 RepID=UPI002F926A5E
MRISTITNLAYVITVGLTLLSGSAFIMSTHYAGEQERAAEAAWALDESIETLARSAEATTEDARLYVFTGEGRYQEAFQRALDQERERERSIRLLLDQPLPVEEANALKSVQDNAEALDAIEEAAVENFSQGRAEQARTALFSPEHEEAQFGLLSSVEHFVDLVSTRTQAELERTRAAAELWGTVARWLLASTALVFLSVLYFVLTRRVTRPLLQMSGIVKRLAKQDFDVQVVADNRRDEIGDMNEAIQIFRQNGLERERLDRERRKDQETKDQILQLMHRLQACRQESELPPVLSLYAERLFPQLAGHLCVMNDGRTTLTVKGTWGNPSLTAQEFGALECWAIRRGRVHLSAKDKGDVTCAHVGEEPLGAALCVPLAARGDTVGVLYFEGRGDSEALAKARVYIELVAENLALAIANIQLRDRLANLAVRDPLTGLLNRRSLDEGLKRLSRQPEELPAALMMIDIDHFKRFNDEFGHDAGDFVMNQVAAVMTDIVKGQGVVYRFGGEEFSVIVPKATKTSVLSLAENLRSAIANNPVGYQGQPLGSVTVSVGVASTEDGQTASTLLQRADAALFQAKTSGRDAVRSDWTMMHD